MVDWATQRFEESQLVRWCVWFLVPSFLAMAAATTVGLLMVALVPLVTGAMLVGRCRRHGAEGGGCGREMGGGTGRGGSDPVIGMTS